ncbi:TetR/AcrR family transcriptional regulator [Lentzea sp. NPDC058436]|uniref:TetR/AcrR family transcriptional regulator n=1 Tax=Lentzea sp. NPDC058436 TaxID=3346499 RepID=UPI0036669AEF
MNTADRLVAAAAELLDSGGEVAVTLRAVAAATGVSHNAPYKHFPSRDDLLAAVAAADFDAMAAEWVRIRTSPSTPAERLANALDVLVKFGREHPARYGLLFNSPELAGREGPLRFAAEEALDQFAAIIEDQQNTGDLPAAPADHLAVLLAATAHGLINADAGGRLRRRTNWAGVGDGLQTLIKLLSNH